MHMWKGGEGDVIDHLRQHLVFLPFFLLSAQKNSTLTIASRGHVGGTASPFESPTASFILRQVEALRQVEEVGPIQNLHEAGWNPM